MYIGIITPVFPPYLAGMGNVAAAEAKELSKLGNDVVVLTPDYGKGNKDLANVKVIRQKPFFSFGNAAWLNNFPAEFASVDVIHFHYPFLGGVNALLKFKKKFPQIPIVVTYHMDLVGHGWKKFFFEIYTSLTLPKLIEMADKVIVSSNDYAKSGFLKKFMLANPQKFVELPFGVDAERFKMVGEEEKRKLKQKIGIAEKEKAVLFVGALDKAHYFKGLALLLTAFKDQEDAARLVIVGGGECLNDYKKLVQNLGLEKKVFFAGRVSEEDLPNYYTIADLFVLPSLDRSEAYGMVILEALSCGTVPVASDLPGVRTLVKQGGGETFTAGAVGSLSDIIKNFLADDENRLLVGRKGRDWVVQNRSLKKETDVLLTVYKLLAKAGDI